MGAIMIDLMLLPMIFGVLDGLVGSATAQTTALFSEGDTGRPAPVRGRALCLAIQGNRGA